MALVLGFFVLFVAGVGGAYLAGAHAARRNSPSTPLQRANASALAQRQSEVASASESTVADKAAAVISPAELAATQLANDHKSEAELGVFADTRSFKRLAFSGTAQATIYPYPQKLLSTNEPIQCTVLTRDLCCGGVGIAHTERLVPHQTIVLDALGKLLVGEVRWCQRIDKDFYIAGCRLVKTKT